MESKILSQPSKHNSQLYANEEELNKKSNETQKQQDLWDNNDDTEQEQNIPRISLLSQKNLIFNSRIYQEHIKTYSKSTSLYFMNNKRSGEIEFLVYDTITKRETIKAANLYNLSSIIGACFAHLPNGNLFIFGSSSNPRRIILINRDFLVHELPSEKYCFFSSAIYYNRNVYCFGGSDYFLFGKPLTFCNRFDLDQNKWFSLSPLPEPAMECTSVIFNGKILISSPKETNLWIYSINIDSFSIISYRFNLGRKVMANAEERLYLIECYKHWNIYESEIWDEFSLKLIVNFENIDFWAYSCIYNKEKKRIYILSFNNDHNLKSSNYHYYKFNLIEKVLVK